MKATVQFEVETYEMTADRLSELIGDVLWGSDSMPSGCDISPIRVSIEAEDYLDELNAELQRRGGIDAMRGKLGLKPYAEALADSINGGKVR